MSKKKQRLKLGAKYEVTYYGYEGGSREAWGFLDSLPRQATLAEILANCRKHKVDATVRAVEGGLVGTVNPDGTYRFA
jgi:hypothetical protein